VLLVADRLVLHDGAGCQRSFADQSGRMAVFRTFPSRDALPRLRFRFRPLDAVVGAGIFLLIYIAVRVGATAHVPLPRGQAATTINTSPSQLPYYAVRSLLRMFIALFFSFAFSLGYAYAAARSRRARLVMIPALDILQSVPVLGFLAVMARPGPRGRRHAA
jgi:NitT/TauT family transport system permease protein